MKYISVVFFIVVFFIGCSKHPNRTIEVDMSKHKAEKQSSITIESNQEKKEEVGFFTQLRQSMKAAREEDGFNVAVVFPSQVVGKYAIDGVNSITSYLLFKDIEYNLVTYDFMSEEKSEIDQIKENIDFDKYRYVILYVTKDGLKKFTDSYKDKNLKIYAPLINKNDVEFDAPNVVFGGLDYIQQFKELFKLIDEQNISEFHDSVSLGQTLSYKLDNLYNINYKYQKRLTKNSINYESFLRRNIFLRNSNIILNTPIVQTSILLSQMRAYEIHYNKLLSTQINYTPLILSLTQTADRRNMIIANSIEQIDDKLIEYGAILNTDFKYNWVNYSTLIGIDYLLSQRFNDDRFFNNNIENNQVLFNVSLFESGNYSFKPFYIK